MTLNLYYRHLNDDVPSFHRAHPSDAGLDLHSTEGLDLGSGLRALVGTGLAVAIPEGCVGLVCSRSGLTLKRGLAVANAPGIVDSGYRGEIKVVLHNIGPYRAKVRRGDRIAQLVIVPFQRVDPVLIDVLPEGDRGAAGFGSTGETTVTGVPVDAKSLAEAEAELAKKLVPIPPPPDNHPHGYYRKTPEGYALMLNGKVGWGAPITTPLPDHTDPDAPELIHLTDEGFEVVLTPSERPTPTTLPADIHPHGYYKKTSEGYALMSGDETRWGASTTMPLPDHTAVSAPELIFFSDGGLEVIPEVHTDYPYMKATGDITDDDPLILESVSWPGGGATLPEGVPMTDSSAVAEALRDLATWITRDHSSEEDGGEGEVRGILNLLLDNSEGDA